MKDDFIPFSIAVRELKSRLSATKSELAMWVFLDELTAWVSVDNELSESIVCCPSNTLFTPNILVGKLNDNSNHAKDPILWQLLIWGFIKYKPMLSGTMCWFLDEGYIEKPWLPLTHNFFYSPKLIEFKPQYRWLTYSQLKNVVKERINDSDECAEFINSIHNPVHPIKGIEANHANGLFLEEAVLAALDELYPTTVNKTDYRFVRQIAHRGENTEGTPQSREYQLHKLIWDVYCKLKKQNPKGTAQQVWNELRYRREKYENYSIITSMDEKNITWNSPRREGLKLKRKSFDSVLSRLKRKNICG